MKELEQLRNSIENFIRASPDFPRSNELASKLGTSLAEVELLIIKLQTELRIAKASRDQLW